MTPAPDYSPDPTLTPQQHRIITLLVQGQTINEAADAENLHRNSVANWRRTVPAFARELEFALREQREYWHDHATRLVPQAMQILEATLTDPKASPSLRFRAAAMILKMATATPKAKPNKGFPDLSPETEALHGEFLQMNKNAQDLAENAAQMHNRAQQEQEIFDIDEAARISTLQEKLPENRSKPQPIRVPAEPGRNTQCPCGSNLKYNRCCLNKAA